MNLDDLAHFTLREWTRMSIAPTEVEVERAKSQLKANMLLGLEQPPLLKISDGKWSPAADG